MAIYDYGILKTLGGRMLEVRDGYAKATLELSEKVMQPSRVFHAGAIVTLADEVASAAIHGEDIDTDDMKGKKFPYSIQLSVNLLTNDAVGPLTAEANVVRRGRLTVVDTIVTTSDGKTAVLMRSTHMMVEPDKNRHR
ncbi:MAG: PaaI family thioesterase [Cyanobacteria bacterium]|nr:PaaI family thioesterase [Cyanobacteriota bacterium]